MGWFRSCMQCLRLVPWSSLIAVVFCWTGTALFGGAAHEALSNTKVLLELAQIPGFNETVFVANDLFQSLQYAIYGIAAYMLVLSILLFVDGILATRNVKRDFNDGCKSSTCGICIGIYYTALTYLTSCGWLLIACFSALPIYFLQSASNQCTFIRDNNCDGQNADPCYACINFVQAGLMKQTVPGNIASSSYGQLCDQDLLRFCNAQQFDVVSQLSIIAVAGAALALISTFHFLMCLSANFAYVKMSRKLVEYEDAKYREEMELNDIINTARSNERLTH